MITKFNHCGYTCCYHYCDYFEQWVGWSSLNNNTYYCDNHLDVVDILVTNIDNYLMAFS